jgi:hypothetical protein
MTNTFRRRTAVAFEKAEESASLKDTDEKV